MIFHNASDMDCKHGIQAIFNALFIKLKSIIASQHCFVSLMIVDFFIFAGFPSQIKWKICFSISLIKSSGITRTDALKINLESPNVLTMLIFPLSVRFLFSKYSGSFLSSGFYLQNLVHLFCFHHKKSESTKSFYWIPWPAIAERRFGFVLPPAELHSLGPCCVDFQTGNIFKLLK